VPARSAAWQHIPVPRAGRDAELGNLRRPMPHSPLADPALRVGMEWSHTPVWRMPFPAGFRSVKGKHGVGSAHGSRPCRDRRVRMGTNAAVLVLARPGGGCGGSFGASALLFVIQRANLARPARAGRSRVGHGDVLVRDLAMAAEHRRGKLYNPVPGIKTGRLHVSGREGHPAAIGASLPPGRPTRGGTVSRRRRRWSELPGCRRPAGRTVRA
jgi:hypothetical protein